MDYKHEGKQRPRKRSCQCAVHLGLSRERSVIVVQGRGRARRVVPGKKRAVLGREVAVVVEAHLVQLGLYNGGINLCRVQKVLRRRLGHQSPNLPR